MKSRALTYFRLIVAIVVGLFFVIAAVNSRNGQSLSLPWKSVPWVFKALFGLMWRAQSYFPWRQLRNNEWPAR
jgi:hypothetical protein